MTYTVDTILDEKTRDNFRAIRETIESDPMWVREFVPIEINVDAAVTEGRIAHAFGSIPTDLIQTWLEGAGTITWNFTKFTDKMITYSTTGACKVRALVGRVSGRKL